MSLRLAEQLSLVLEYLKTDKTDFNQAWDKSQASLTSQTKQISIRRRIPELSNKLKLHNKIGTLKENIKVLYQFPQLTTFRQSEIVIRMLEGKSNREIADELCITDKTVKFHKRNIFKSCGFKNTLTMVAYAANNQFLPKGK